MLTLPADEATEVFRVEGVALMFAEIKASLAEFGVHFDVVLQREGPARPRRAGARPWTGCASRGTSSRPTARPGCAPPTSATTRTGCCVRSNGEWTYFAADCAYYLDKRERGFDRVVIMLGADHHGYIGRMKAMAACFGDDPDAQPRDPHRPAGQPGPDGQPVRMSKRAGTVVTLEDLVDAIGVDAARYALARYSIDSPIDIDIDLWTRASNDNPVYYVQYAHARIASVLRNAAELGRDRGATTSTRRCSSTSGRTTCSRRSASIPAVVATAAELREPHRVARYLEDLAGAYHRFYDDCRVLPQGDEPVTDLHRARLWLVDATRIVIANGLGLLGVSAPERM